MIDIKKLTLEEKLKMLTGRNLWEIETSGKVPEFIMSDGPNGCRTFSKPQDWTSEALPSHCYPSLSVVANSWDEELAELDGESLANDFIEKKRDMALAPGVNIKRTPLCGRNFEYFSEDPYLTGKLAKRYIDGIQKTGIGSCIKHYAANNREYERCHNSSNVDERTLNEIYLKNFRMAFEAKPWAVMCSYNKINGIYASENRELLVDYLRNKFGYEGVALSDWGAVHNRYKALKAGLELDMPYQDDAFDSLKSAYDKGLITDEEIDCAVIRILQMIDKNEEAKKWRKITLTDEERHQNAIKVAEEGMVLLKNDGILPIKSAKKLSVLGRFSDTPAKSGGGSANIKTYEECKSLLDELKSIYKDTEFYYNVCYNCDEQRGFTGIGGINAALFGAEKSDAVIITVGTDFMEEKEGKDREDIKLQPGYVRAINDLAKYYYGKVIVVMESSSAIDVSDFIDNVSALIYTGFAGEGMNTAIANIISGKVNPSGKLSETFPLCLEDCYVSPDDDATLYDDYTDGVFVGYRHFDRYGLEVRYPFGYGLSYSKFTYSNLKLKKFGETDYEITYTITNESDVDGKEISEVYMHDFISTLERPPLELVAFRKDFIKAHESKTVSVKIDKEAFSYYLPPIHDFYVENGTFTVYVGGSSRDLPLSEDIEVNLPDETQFSVDIR